MWGDAGIGPDIDDRQAKLRHIGGKVPIQLLKIEDRI